MRWITAAEARLNVPRVNTNAKVLIHTIVLVDIGIMDHIVPTAVTIQRDAVTVILAAEEEAHRNAHRESIHAAVLIHTTVLVDIGIVDHIVPTAAIRQPVNARVVPEAVAAHRNAHRVSINAKVLILTIVHMVHGHQMNIVPTAATRQQVNAMSVQMETISAKVLIPTNVHLVPGNLMNIVLTAATHLPVNAQVTSRVLMILMENIPAQTAHI